MGQGNYVRVLEKQITIGASGQDRTSIERPRMPQDFAPLLPEPLRPGARIAVIAPSSPFDRTLVYRGLGWLSERYRLEWDQSLFTRQGFLAGSDERRRGELDRCLRDPGLAAVITARGGYGLSRIAERVDWGALARHPKWLIGFSDATLLHLFALRAGVASLHAQNVAGLGRGDAKGRERFTLALEAPRGPRTLDGLSCWVAGRARGPLVAGNLTLLESCLATGRLWLPPGAILAIEDVTEQAYRVDRMLSSLFAAGAADRIAGVVVGDFTDCPPSRGVSVTEVLRERLATLRVPVLGGLRFGHGVWNEPLVIGQPAALDAERGTLTLGA
jgi:muramoyltetrapeptide carboxypeptidase